MRAARLCCKWRVEEARANLDPLIPFTHCHVPPGLANYPAGVE